MYFNCNRFSLEMVFWALTRNINIYRDYSITSTNNRIRIVIITTTVSAASHADHPFWFWHLIVNTAKRRCHFICQRSGHYNAIRLSWARSKYHPESIHIVSRCSKVHHLYGTACKTERQWP